MEPLNRTIIREGGGFPGRPFEFESAANLTGFPLMHGVTRRFGGVSQKPFDSFNLGLHVDDQVQAVVENRRRLAKHLRVRLEELTCAKQVHGISIAQVTEFNRGYGSTSLQQAIPDSDAMITNLPKTPLLLLVADCVPVLFYDVRYHAIAVVHAGWRGAIGHLPALTLDAMAEAYGTSAADCYAYLGPSIQADSFEVSETLADQFRKETTRPNEIVYYRYRSDKEIETPRVDLQQFIVHDLLDKGVPLRQITVSGTDTLTSPSCYSYRREHGKTGRMALFAMLSARP
ncbi:peptidoglycan editing factor PgeF [uncultured Veillonella sp.]|uniref:peptidoglycan editing factor PgeF n=1 Tax=uncultured Veillonella sp. TaxID=159268 RepID=UPI0025EC4029|nr:peptidoglycan editing factor PgeF [uncultured Veillonella sp.]MDY3973659.1 peptidoglycan editing factor PgeF [Veillonella caviae]